MESSEAFCQVLPSVWPVLQRVCQLVQSRRVLRQKSEQRPIHWSMVPTSEQRRARSEVRLTAQVGEGKRGWVGFG